MLGGLAGFDLRRTDLLLEYILVAAAHEDDLRDRELGPIHFLKYAYLGDLAYAARHEGQSSTGALWQFYHFGPWQAQIHDRIDPALAAIHANRRTLQSVHYESDFLRFSVSRDRVLEQLRERLENELPLGVTGAVRSAIHEFGSNTAALLRYVYTTPPMVSAAPGETLNLAVVVSSRSSAQSESEPRMSKTQQRRRAELLTGLRSRVQERLAGRGSISPAVSPAPRYDAVFAAGAEWLDVLGGDPVEEVSGELTISQDVWKSPTRTERMYPDDSV